MGNWIIHIVGETVDDDLAEPISKFVKEIQSLAHKVHQVRLTTDAGEKIVHIANTVETDVDTVAKDAAEVDPSLAPVATTVESGVAEADKAVDTAVTDIEKDETPVVTAPVDVVTPSDPTVTSPTTPEPVTTSSDPSSPVTDVTTPTTPTTPPAPIPTVD